MNRRSWPRVRSARMRGRGEAPDRTHFVRSTLECGGKARESGLMLTCDSGLAGLSA